MAVASVSASDDDGNVFLRRVALQNLLSFGPDETDLELQPLNVLIGPNGSGKSNLIAAIGLLQAAPKDLTAPIRATGGIDEWLHKGERRAPGGSIHAVVFCPSRHGALHYRLTVEEHGHRCQVGMESVEDNESEDDRSGGRAHYVYSHGMGTLAPRHCTKRLLPVEELDPEQSILSQLKDPHTFPEMTALGKQFGGIRIYREWSFGQRSPTRSPQPSDFRNDFLAEDTSNLGLVLNRLRRTPAVKKRLLEAARKLYRETHGDH